MWRYVIIALAIADLSRVTKVGHGHASCTLSLLYIFMFKMRRPMPTVVSNRIVKDGIYLTYHIPKIDVLL